MRAHVELIALAVISACLFLLSGQSRAGDFLDAQRKFSRVAAAVERQVDDVAASFRAVGAAWPPRGVYLRAFKLEGQVELWARAERGARFVPVRTFDICLASGRLGPKLQEGDLQVPEGAYEIEAFQPRSAFHLALRVSYPDASDRARARADGVPPGGDIMIHGGCATVGCLPLRDGPMEALYVAAVYARDAGSRPLRVDLHPCRHETELCRVALQSAPQWSEHFSRLAIMDAEFLRDGRPAPLHSTLAHASNRQ